MRFHALASFPALFLTTTLAAQGATQRDSAVALPGISVTATREPSSILKAPLAITKITAPTLRGINGFGIEEALSLVPGVVAQSRFGTSDVRLMIRGFGSRGAGDRSNAGTSRGVRVLIDGFPETEPDGRTSFDHLDMAAAEAVEVVRSNASSIYGNGSGGVVNILTVPNVSKPSYEYQPIYGGFGLQRHVVRLAAPAGNGTAYLTFTNTTFEGWRKHSDARRATLHAGVVGPIGPNTRLGVYLEAANNLSHLPGPLTQAQVDADPTQPNANYLTRDERRYNRLGRLGVSVDHAFNATTSVSSMFYVNPKYLQRSERNSFRDFTRYHLGGNVIARKSMELGGMKSGLTAGMDEAYQDGAILFYSLATDGTRGTTNTQNKGEGASNVGFFLHDDIAVNDKLSVLLGARYDNVNYYYRTFIGTDPVKYTSKQFDRVSPRLGFSYMLAANTALYGNVGGGVEVPAGNETDAVDAQASPKPLINPLLDAINSTTYEVGLKGNGKAFGPVTVGYDIAAYDIEVKNEIIPYKAGAFYATAAAARRNGLEIGANATTARGIFGAAAITLANNKYQEYVIDSSLYNATLVGHTVDYSDNVMIGVPKVVANGEIGMELPMYRGARIKAGVEHYGEYFVDDANAITVPAYTVINLTAELRKPIVIRNNYSVRGFVTVHNVADTKYIGSGFLNPDLVSGAPAAFEPGMPQTVIVSFSIGRLR